MSRTRLWFPAGAVILTGLIFIAYLPALHGQPVWDDDYMLTANPVMTEPHGLWRIWFDLSAIKVYYPLTLSVLWLECRVFGLASLTGFHVVNTLLHAANAILLWRLLRRLDVTGAFAIAAIWGLHPVAVESVAWITEHKNTLSGFFYLDAVWALLRYFSVIGPAAKHPGRWYLLALLSFTLSLAAKSTAVTFPAAALLVVWWKTGRIRTGNVWAIVPFLLLAVASGSLTQYVEVHTTGIWNPAWSLTAVQKILVAGRAICFYASKVIFPAGLSFIYPRWVLEPAALWQWVYVLAVIAALAGLWKLRARLGRGPITGMLFFCGTLVPCLGFFHVLYQRYSFVADHFQYLADAGLIAVIVGAAACLRISQTVQVAMFLISVATLEALTFNSAKRFSSDEAVWTAALQVDPTVPMANLNYASDLINRQEYRQPIELLHRAAATPMFLPNVWANLGRIAEAEKDYKRALECYQHSVELGPMEPATRFQYGNMLLVAGHWTQAADQLRMAIQFDPRYAAAHDNLGVCLLHLGQPQDALREFQIAQQLNPNLPLLRRHLQQATE